MNKEDLEMLEELINDEIESYFKSGYNIESDYIKKLRNLLRKLNLKEYYDYDKWKHKLGV